MTKKILSRYSMRYARSLVYMLQASEYHTREFLAWVARARNFSVVEDRKRFDPTVKALFLTILLYSTQGFLIITAIVLGVTSLYGALLAVAVLVLLPFVLPYILVVYHFLFMACVQLPYTQYLLHTTKRRLAHHPALKIGVAGSYGKTTMREMLKTVLAEGMKVASPQHSHNTPLGITAFAKTLTGDEEVIIFELGEYYPGDVRKLCELVQPSYGVLTGVNEAHLEKFKSTERTAETIFELADYLQDKNVYVNGDSPLARAKARASHTLYSSRGIADWEVHDAHTSIDGTSFAVHSPEGVYKFSSKLLGLHQVGPLCVVAYIAHTLGLSMEQIQRGIAHTEPFEHRMQPATDATGVTTIDDSYNGNPDGVQAAIAFLEQCAGRRRVYVTPGLVEIGEASRPIHRKIGSTLAQAGVETVVLIKNSVTPYIAEGLQEAGYGGEVLWYETAMDAYRSLSRVTTPGDIVLLQNDWPDQYA